MISRRLHPRSVQIPLGIGLSLILLLLIATGARGDTIRVKTDRGTFLVEVDAIGVTVRGEGDDLVVSRTGGDEIRLRLDPEVATRTSTDPVLTLRRDGKVIVSARRISTRIAPSSTPGTGGKLLGGRPMGSAWGLVISPDGKTLVSGHQGFLRVWDLTTLTERFNVPTGKTVRRVALTPDGATIASAEYSYQGSKAFGNVVIRDAKTGAARRVMEPEVPSLHAVTMSPDGQVAVSSSWSEPDIRVWSVEKGQQVGTLKGHSGSVGTVVYSPDGKTLASCGDAIRLWDVDTGAVRKTLRGHEKSVESVAFSADGKTLASGGFDDTARVWDTTTGAQLATFEHEEPVLSVAITADGKTVASAGARWGNGFYGQAPAEVKVWDVATGKAVATLPQQSNQIFAMVFTPDGKSLITASLSGAVTVWDLAAFQDGQIPPKADQPRNR